MDIYKTFDTSGKKETITSCTTTDAAITYIKNYIRKYVEKIYGEEHVDQIIEYGTMTSDEWSSQKESARPGHYFIIRTDSPGYDVYAKYSVDAEYNGYFTKTITNVPYKNVFCIFGLQRTDVNDICESVLEVRKSVEDRQTTIAPAGVHMLGEQVAGIAKARYHL